MMTHVLKFGNDALDESVEVMGICIGKENEIENDFNLLNVIPFHHGIQVSTGFTKEDVELLANMNKEYQEKDLKIIGWYISRPGWGLDFTDITIQNHKFFQTVKNPQGFIIIFDHTLMGKEKEFGFKIYSLKDYKKSDDYHEIPYEIEMPANLNFFKWVQKFVEDSQKLSPVIIKDLKEQSIRELQEIPLSTEDLVEDSIKDYSAQVEQIFTGFSSGISKVNEIVSGTYKSQLNSWVGDINQGTLKGMEYLNRSTNQLKDTISDGLKDVQNFFNSTFIEISSLFKKNITEYIDKRIKGQKELKDKISEKLDQNIDVIKAEVMGQIKNVINPLEEKINSLLETMDKNSQLNSKMADITIELTTLVSEADNSVKDLTSNIGDHIEKVIAPFKTQIAEKSEELDSELKPIQESHTEIKILLEKLQKIITDFRNLT
jgi:gas vesicle protein